MSPPATSDVQPALPIYRTERVISSLTMAWVIILTTYMIFQDHALSHTSMYFLKIILSMSGAVMLATLPGFIDINYSLGGLSVRAAGGAAAFVFIFTQSPSLPVLKLDPALTRPAPAQAPPPSNELSSRSDEFPVLVALSIDPMSLLPAPAQTGLAAVPVVPGHSAGRVGLGGAVIADARALAGKAATLARNALRRLRGMLDQAASALRSGVDRLLAAARGLLGTDTAATAPGETIALLTGHLSGRFDTAIDALLGPDALTVSTQLGGVGDLGASLIGALGDTAGGIVAATDGTVQALAGGVQNTAHLLLDTTDTIASGVTDLLDETTGGLTSGLTRPVNALIGGVTSTAGGLVDGVVPVATKTTSRVLTGVGNGLDTITERLNAVSPSLVSQTDLDFAGAHTADGADLTAPLLGKLDASLGNLGGGELGLLSGRDGALLAGRFADPLGGERLTAGRGCISGCGQSGLVHGVGSGLRDTVGALGLGRGRSLGGLGGSGPAAGDGAGPPARGESAAGGRGGPISSTVGRTGSLVKGITRSLGRR